MQLGKLMSPLTSNQRSQITSFENVISQILGSSEFVKIIERNVTTGYFGEIYAALLEVILATTGHVGKIYAALIKCYESDQSSLKSIVGPGSSEFRIHPGPST